MKDQLAKLIADILKEMGIPELQIEVSVPEDPSHGDYTTNVAMKLWRSPQSPVSPRSPRFSTPMDIALSVKEAISRQLSVVRQEASDQNTGKHGLSRSPRLPLSSILSAIDHVDVARPGFLNVFLTEASLITQLQEVLKQKEAVRTGRKIMVEFAHPNTHKTFHIGHLRNITTGESIVRLLESQGHTVIRTNYQGDVGMHIAKCLYGILHSPQLPQLPRLPILPLSSRIEFLGKAYAAGSKAYEEDEAAKRQIGEINRKIYAKDPGTYPLYKETRQWSLDYFDAIYKRVGSRFDRLYFESEVYEPGKKLVRNGVKKGIFEESDGAVIFPGKKYGLHNRVFVTGEGNATYEGKELALAAMENSEFGRLDKLIHVVGPEQASFFTVTFKAEELLGIVKPGVQHHLVYGWVKLKHGKMSSRSGNVVLGEWLLDEAKKSIYAILEKTSSKESSPISSLSPRSPLSSAQKDEIAEKAAVAAVKYAFLKVSTLQEIAFDIQTSVSFDGDSGPYLLYTYARCKSVLRKAGLPPNFPYFPDFPYSFNPEERAVARLLTFFPDAVAQAADTYSPSALCTYLFTLAQAFNVFYAKHPILPPNFHDHLNFPDSSFRLSLTAATAHVLATGLYLLGIETLERM